MDKASFGRNSIAIPFTLILSSGPASAQNSCTFEAIGTTVPNTSGSPLANNTETGTVISVNFFYSGAKLICTLMDPPDLQLMEPVKLQVNGSSKFAG